MNNFDKDDKRRREKFYKIYNAPDSKAYNIIKEEVNVTF